MEYQGLSKKALKVMYVSLILRTIIVLILAAIAALIVATEDFSAAGVVLLCIGIIALLSVVYCIVVPLFRFKRYQYLIAEDRIEIIEGIFFVDRTIVPIDRIHQIDIMKGPIDTIFNVAKVVVTTAGSKAVFRFLELEKADTIASYLNDTIRKKISAQRGNNNVQ